MRTDEGKVSQILRNFISNALKYTERGHVRISARLDSAIGVGRLRRRGYRHWDCADDHQRIFDEFAQVDHPLQRKFKGTGLGLPLSKRLTELLGGRLWVESEPGVGSTFFAEIPIVYRARSGEIEDRRGSWDARSNRALRSSSSKTPSRLSSSTRRFSSNEVPDRWPREVCRWRGRRFAAAAGRDHPRHSPAGEETWSFLCQLKDAPARRTSRSSWSARSTTGRKGTSLGADVMPSSRSIAGGSSARSDA